MAEQTENIRLGAVSKWEVPLGYCREVLTIKQDGAATEGLPVGQILEDDSGEVVCTTGSNADAILLERVELDVLTDGSCSRVCLVRGPAVVDSDQLTIDSAQKSDALAALAALGIQAYDEPTYTTG